MRDPSRLYALIAAAALAASCGSEPGPADATAPADIARPGDVADAAAPADLPPSDVPAAVDASDAPAPQDVTLTGDVPALPDIVDAGPPPPPPLTVMRVVWNATDAGVGAVQAVAEDANLVAVYTDLGLRVMVAGAVAASDNSVRSWRTAIAAGAADGSGGTWVLGVDAMSRVYRVRDRTTLEDVTARLALGMRDIRSSARASADTVVFGGMGAFAVLRGSEVTVWNDPDFAEVVGGGGRIASYSAAGIKVFDLAMRSAVRFALTGVTGVALTGEGRVLATVGNLVYAQNERGELAPIYTHDAPLRAPTASGETTWIVSGGRLGIWDGFRVRVSMDVAVGPTARLIAARDGGLWVIENGALSRYALVVDPEEQRWNTAVRTIFATRCTPCHLPGGSADIDLSTRCAWSQRRDAIRTQVVERMLMPPPPNTMPAQERMAIAAYLDTLGADDCGPRPDGGVPRDVVAMDVPRDAGVTDVPRDVAMDAARDAGVADVPRDVAMDVPRDVAMDVPRDVATDAPRDVATDAPRDVPRDTGPADAGPVTYAQVQAIFDRSCTRCHGGSGGLNLSAAVSYGNLVNVAAAGGSCAASGMLRVDPGDPMLSLLYRKVARMQPCGNAMPAAGPLPADEVETIRRWIAAGAPR